MKKTLALFIAGLSLTQFGCNNGAEPFSPYTWFRKPIKQRFDLLLENKSKIPIRYEYAYGEIHSEDQCDPPNQKGDLSLQPGERVQVNLKGTCIQSHMYWWVSAKSVASDKTIPADGNFSEHNENTVVFTCYDGGCQSTKL